MPEFIKKAGKKFFSLELDFRVRLFNILAIAGMAISLTICVTGFITSAGLVNIFLNFFAAVIAFALLWYSSASGKYQFCYTVTIIGVFFFMFPVMFFSAGGYHSGMPSFFVFAALFTVFMIDGKKMAVIVILEMALYISICIYAYRNPDTVNFFDTEKDLLIDTIVGFIAPSIALVITMALHFRLYNLRQKEHEAARRKIEEYARMKNELFAGMSHEMRTPLTVMSAYAQFAAEQIREAGVNEQTLSDLVTISDEAERLAEMADSTLKILMTVSHTDGCEQKYASVDTGVLSSRLARLMEPIASRKGCKLTVLIKDGIPEIPGDANAITQLLYNVLENAITHSSCSIMELIAETHKNGVKITVKDDGTGVDPKILPRVFERGASGKKGGSGIGLSICRNIAEQHGGEINIVSEPDAGTCVTVTLFGIEEEND